MAENQLDCDQIYAVNWISFVKLTGISTYIFKLGMGSERSVTAWG